MSGGKQYPNSVAKNYDVLFKQTNTQTQKNKQTNSHTHIHSVSNQVLGVSTRKFICDTNDPIERKLRRKVRKAVPGIYSTDTLIACILTINSLHLSPHTPFHFFLFSTGPLSCMLLSHLSITSPTGSSRPLTISFQALHSITIHLTTPLHC